MQGIWDWDYSGPQSWDYVAQKAENIYYPGPLQKKFAK